MPLTAPAGETASDLDIPSLDPVVTPTPADTFATSPSDATPNEKTTRAQVHSLEIGEQFVGALAVANTAPPYAFGDGDSGFYEGFDGTVTLALETINRFAFGPLGILASNSGAAGILVRTASDILPTVLPRRSDMGTGLGSPAANQMSFIAGSLDCINIAESGGARQIGFYVTAPISLQTGVAVSAAGIHAALVALGLITA